MDQEPSVELALPDLAPRALRLTESASPPSRTYRTLRTPPGQLTDRVYLGGPYGQRLRPADAAREVDIPVLQRFLDRDPNSYHLVLLSVTFEGEQPPLENAGVRCDLSGPGERPVAWSMAPLVRTGPATEHSTSFRLGADLKLITAGGERSDTGQREDTYLEALRLMRPDPGWAWSRTPTAPLRGTNLLAMVVRAAPGAAVTVEVTVTAGVRRRDRVRTHEVRLPGLVTSRAVI